MEIPLEIKPEEIIMCVLVFDTDDQSITPSFIFEESALKRMEDTFGLKKENRIKGGKSKRKSGKKKSETDKKEKEHYSIIAG
jgi:hypothetical protein